MQLIKLKIHLEQSLVKREISSTPLPLFLGKEIVAGTSLCRAVLPTYIFVISGILDEFKPATGRSVYWAVMSEPPGWLYIMDD